MRIPISLLVALLLPAIAHADGIALKHGVYGPTAAGCAKLTTYSAYNDTLTYNGKTFAASAVEYTVKNVSGTPESLRVDVHIYPNGGIGYGGKEKDASWDLSVQNDTHFTMIDHDPDGGRTGSYLWCASDVDALMNNGGNSDKPAAKAAVPSKPVSLADLRGSSEGVVFDHNGSSVQCFPKRGVCVYDVPKASIAKTVKSGTVLFRGALGKTISGTAYVFKAGCEPAPYHVDGVNFDDMGFTLQGIPPIRDKNSCAILGYDPNSKNAVLIFNFFGDR
jgi:hypothetical protein